VHALMNGANQSTFTSRLKFSPGSGISGSIRTCELGLWISTFHHKLGERLEDRHIVSHVGIVRGVSELVE